MKKRIITLALAVLMTLTTVSAAGAATFKFTDVPTYHKDRVAIEYCVTNEFIQGYTSTLFEPDSPLTREQFAVIWGRTYHLRRHTFMDVTRVPDEFENAILIMQALGHVNGISDTEFGRSANISREQAIAIAHRAYLPGVDGKDAYKSYADSALISDWARDSVSACEAEGLLAGVFSGSELRPKQNITRGEICHLIFNIMKKQYEITLSETVTSGTVTIDKTPDPTDGKIRAYPGETVNLIIKPPSKNILVPGSLKYNGTSISGTSFSMPFEDVTITAEFAPQLTGIVITSLPAKTSPYKVGETLDLSGLAIEATYAVGGSKVKTAYTTSIANGAVLTSPGTLTITVSYTENGITETTSFTVTVTP